jgi:hypothetical protein
MFVVRKGGRKSYRARARHAALLAFAMAAACASTTNDDGDHEEWVCDGAEIAEGSCLCHNLDYYEGQPVEPVSECRANMFGNDGVCCEHSGECSCGRFGCNTGENCECVVGGRYYEPTCAGAVCCASRDLYHGDCRCGPDIVCADYEVPVPSCSAAAALCLPYERKVDRCPEGSTGDAAG